MGAADRVTRSPFSLHPIRRTAHTYEMSRFPYIFANRLPLVCCWTIGTKSYGAYSLQTNPSPPNNATMRRTSCTSKAK